MFDHDHHPGPGPRVYAEWRGEADEKLIRYLLRHRHSSPFEHVHFTFEIAAPILVFRQWHRHRTWSFNEISARYSALPEVFYVPAAEAIGAQSASNRQGRDLGGDADRTAEIAAYRQTCADAFAAYRRLLDAGWPRELARAVLPVSTYSRMLASVNFWNLTRFLDLRLDPHAQHEIWVYAGAILQLIEPIVPIAVSAWQEARL